MTIAAITAKVAIFGLAPGQVGVVHSDQTTGNEGAGLVAAKSASSWASGTYAAGACVVGSDTNIYIATVGTIGTTDPTTDTSGGWKLLSPVGPGILAS